VEVAAQCGAPALLRALHDRGRQPLLVLAYHRIVAVEHDDAYPFDLELISCTPREFAWQMQYIRHSMQPVSLRQVVDHLDGRGVLPPRPVVVTFDDGFIDTYRCAFPILRRWQIPATIFVSTGYLGSSDPFWFELVAYLMMTAAPRTLEVDERPERFPLGSSVEERRRSLRMLQELLKELPDARRSAIIADWSRRFGGRIDTQAMEGGRPLTWGEVREMAACGIEFGSHTVTHPNLARLDEPTRMWELSESKRALEQGLDREIRTLAYPIGTRSAYDAHVMESASRAGFRLALSYVSGANWLTKLAPYELRRQGVGAGTTRGYFQAMTALPDWIS
jgi:peptidoglycan/xylan/chitin deacetylase (PgdA/CDA1 family)